MLLPPCSWCTCDDDSNGSRFASVLPSKAQLSDCWTTLCFTLQNILIGDVSRELYQGEVFDLFFKPRLPHVGRSVINHVTEARSRVEGSPQWKIISSLLQSVKQQTRNKRSIPASELQSWSSLTGFTRRCVRLLKVGVTQNLPVASVIVPSPDLHDIRCKQGTYGHE